ncbi:hypothetical protein [Enterococcus cecorum]|uniref:hypothetical protein n=1 Tax=Enterococcus cecorum TaxID=44008 RepID=UPI0022D3B1E4|nr:hypothetical protein [Enterococcus cecorum]CAI3252210.1 hypothetical protein CIRMBP1248_00031 [Enterococcus cecorum]CAI3257978.1 hypothetical protein CIRMBP1272_00094 [Enterococcus cecorum]CAI3351894.1 hypothetical protein CIRMBP1250_01152 [Enterococcus cecorum]CAI3390993.1 hypothetical protein CIRMBP1254_01242 [Enterococcus cecorum]CAI3394491.1 hypothetical protein CIRMBP1261_01503 [Enterococcus cecorum]
MKGKHQGWKVMFNPNYKHYKSYLNSLSKEKFIDLKVDLQIANSKESLIIHGAFLFWIVLVILAIWRHVGKMIIQMHQKYNLLANTMPTSEANLFDVTYTIGLWITILLLFLFGLIIFKIRLQQRKLYYLKEYEKEMRRK